METPPPAHRRQFVTFYSYKGGTGRSMALANVSWILAASGFRVLTVDWDLEAPGLHRYFRPFLSDPELHSRKGLIDLFWDYSNLMLTPKNNWPFGVDDPKLFADPHRYIIPLEWDKSWGEGCLHLLSAGKQDEAYGNRVRDFDWRAFYERLGGADLIDSFRSRLEYDFIFIDSRTGVADTSGICTLHLPDQVVFFFTYNRQSILGVEAVGKATLDHAARKIRLLPIASRVEKGVRGIEKARTFARERLNSLLPEEWSPDERETYWDNFEIPHYPEYAFEETLALFREPGTQRSGPLADMNWIACNIAGEQAIKPFRVSVEARERYLCRIAFIDPRLAEVDELVKNWSPTMGDTRLRELIADALKIGEPDLEYIAALGDAALTIATRFREIGQSRLSHALTEQTIALQRQSAARSESITARLAASLNILASILGEQGRHDDALKSSSESVTLYEKLLKQNKEKYELELAFSLDSLGSNLAQLHQFTEALTEKRRALEISVQASTRKPEAIAQCAAISRSIAEICEACGQVEGAIDAAHNSVRIYRDLSNERPDAFNPDLAQALTIFARLLMVIGRLDESVANAKEAAQLYDGLASNNSETFHRGASLARTQIANVFVLRGELDAALGIYREQVEKLRSLGDVRAVALNYDRIVEILRERGALDEALRILREQQLPVYTKLGDFSALAATQGKIADILEARGEFNEALRIRMDYELSVYERLDDERSRAVTIGKVADLLFFRGELDEALRIRREEQLPVYERLGDVRSRAVTMGKIADILSARGELDEALRIRREEQLPVYERLGDVRGRSATLQKIAAALLQSGGLEQGRIQEIYEALAESFAIAEHLQAPDGVAIVGVQLAQIMAMGGLTEEALEVLDKAEAAFRKLGKDDGVSHVNELRALLRKQAE